MKYRYLLDRKWDYTKGRALFIMLNPSTADAEKTDPTVARCIRFAHAWGFGSAEIANIFAFRATNPKKLKEVDDPIGEHNFCMIEAAISRASIVIAAWGTLNQNIISNPAATIIDMVTGKIGKKDLYCIKLTEKTREPAHPLYLSGELKPIIYKHKRGDV
jgi:hypothetical protein